MKAKEFVSVISFWERVSFVLGKLVERVIRHKPERYVRLLNFQLFITGAEHLGFDFKSSSDFYILNQKSRSIYLRKDSSDKDVFEQVFIRGEYQTLFKMLQINGIRINSVIDAGANIGLFTLQLKALFPESVILSIEPDPGNFQILKRNIQTLQQPENIRLVNKALWFTDGKVYLNNSFRDGKEWAISVSDNKEEATDAVDAITVSSLMKEHKMDVVDLFKIDIEGAESEIFRDDRDLLFLKKVKCLVLEIHDEFNSRERIYKILRSNNFMLFDSFEYTIGLNAEYFAS
ncbi:MAG TPA: FkbM family methyltransferase [Puia sp.]